MGFVGDMGVMGFVGDMGYLYFTNTISRNYEWRVEKAEEIRGTVY